MIATMVAGPALEPVNIYDAKTHLRVTTDTDDAYITGLITTARQYVEQISGRKLITQTWELRLDQWPDDAIVLPFGSLQSVTSVTYTDTDGTEYILSTDDYSVDTSSPLGRIVLDSDASWPAVSLAENLPIVIRFVCGYGDNPGDVPGPLVQAVKFGVADLYENRESVVVGVPVASLPIVQQLIAPYRLYGYHL